MSQDQTKEHLKLFQEVIDQLKSNLKSILSSSIEVKFYVDAIDMCFVLHENNENQENHDVINFIEECFFGTHVCSELWLNQNNINTHDGEGKLYSCNHDNSYVINDFNKKEFLIVTHPCALVIDKHSVKEFKTLLLKQAIGLCYDDDYLKTG